MKRIMIVLALLAIAAAAAAGTATAAGPAKVKLGVYDTRAVAIAYARTEAFGQSMMDLRKEYMAAAEAKDAAKQKACEQKGQWTQVRMHLRGFSTAGAADLLGDLKAQLPAIAKQAGVIAIVSKWEVPFSDPSVELVDVTTQVVGLFNPDAATKQVLVGMRDQAPVPLDEIPLDGKDQ